MRRISSDFYALVSFILTFLYLDPIKNGKSGYNGILQMYVTGPYVWTELFWIISCYLTLNL